MIAAADNKYGVTMLDLATSKQIFTYEISNCKKSILYEHICLIIKIFSEFEGHSVCFI